MPKNSIYMDKQSKAPAKIVSINGLETDFFNPTVKNYLSKNDFPNELVNQLSDVELANKITGESRFNSTYRKGLVNEIYEQYSRSGIQLEDGSVVKQNIEKLKDKNTLTVTTGQQIHPFLGPLFVVNKILSCCSEARLVDDKLTEFNAIPIFWMATEDHDFDEIKSAKLYNETYTWDIDSTGPVGRLNPASLLPIVALARQRIDATPDNIRFLDICENAYSSCSTFADATRLILHNFFGETGIVILDPDSRFLKSHLTENIKKDLFDHSNSDAIKKSIDILKKNKIKPPINTRPINYFLVSDLERKRIEKKGDTFQLIDGSATYSFDQINDLLSKSPEIFSPNALIRPLYQQTILPNLAYVCGGGEFMYWLELEQSMSSNDIIYPRLIIRKSVFFSSSKNMEVLDKENIPPEVLFYNKERFGHFFVQTSNSQHNLVNSQIQRIEDETSNLITFLEEAEKGRLTKVRKQVSLTIEALKSQTKRLFFEDLRTNPSYNRVGKIQSKLWTEDYIQERKKDIISSIDEAKMALLLFKNDYIIFTDSREIVLLIK